MQKKIRNLERGKTMLKILLLCSGGMSTSILMKKIEQAAQAQGKEVKVEAYGAASAPQHVGKWDVCLLGPQVRFELENVKKTLDFPVEVIDMLHYGMADGEKVYAQAVRLSGK